MGPEPFCTWEPFEEVRDDVDEGTCVRVVWQPGRGVRVKARNRLLCPQVLIDGDLWDLGQAHPGLPILQGFMGLLCWADREGRFPWKPRELRVGILPYWEGDYAAILDALEQGRFITRYEVDGRVYGHVRTFSKHQSVNHREEQSKLPPPPGLGDADEEAVDEDGVVTRVSRRESSGRGRDAMIEAARRAAMPRQGK